MLPRHQLDAIRFENLAEAILAPRAVVHRVPLQVRAWQTTERPRVTRLPRAEFQPVDLGWRWGPAWSTTWFQLSAAVPEEFVGQQITVQFSSGTEATLWRDGCPFHGLDANRDLVRLPGVVASTEPVEYLVEAACTLPLGASTFWWDHPEVQARWREDRPGRLESAFLLVLDDIAWSLNQAWDFARRLVLALPPEREASNRLLAGMHDLAARLATEEPSTLLSALRTLLQEGCGPPQAGGPCIAVGHAHIDTAWLWPIAETRRKCLRSFATMLRLMERYEDFCFLCSQAQQYAWIEEDSPELFAQIAQRVREGRWEPGGAMWVEPDCNVPSGESLVRQMIHGTKYWRERFGDAGQQRHLYLPDTFGFPASLPQIIRLSGLDTFITNKISWSETNRFPYVTFQWRGIDGSEVLSHLTPGHNYNSPIEPSDVLAGQRVLQQQPQPRPETWLQPFGYGDGGGGPTDEMLERIGLSESAAGLPPVIMGRADTFCQQLHEATQHRPALPTWDGDLYLELHRGTYTSQAWLKMANRLAEDQLRCLEVMAMGQSPQSTTNEPTGELDALWKLVLLNQFHDILPGSSIPEVYRDARADYDHIESVCRRLLADQDDAWVDGLGDGTVCFNPASTPRSGVVDVAGRPTWISEVPPLGAKLVEGEPPDGVTIDGLSLRNGHLEVTLDAAGNVAHLAAMRASASVHRDDQPLGQLVLYEDHPRRWEAWDLDSDYVETAQPVGGSAEIEIIEKGPLRAVIEFRRPVGESSRVVQRYVLCAGAPRIDVHYRVDWRENRRLLRLLCPTDIRARQGTVGIQFGVQERPTHRNTSWEQAQFEFPGHRFMDLSEPGRGLAVLDNGRYGRSFEGGTMGVSLLRAPRMPDPEADRGTHEFTMSFMPHDGDWRSAGVWHEAEALCRPLRVLGPGRGSGTSHAPFRINVDGTAAVEVVAFKPAERGYGRVLRMVEVHGGSGDVEIEWSTMPTEVRSVDLHESQAVPLEFDHRAGRTRLAIRPFQIVTLLIDGRSS